MHKTDIRPDPFGGNPKILVIFDEVYDVWYLFQDNDCKIYGICLTDIAVEVQNFRWTDKQEKHNDNTNECNADPSL